MRRDIQGVVLALVGATVLRLSVTDMMLAYVKPGMRPFLIAAGAVLVILGLLSAFLDSGAKEMDGQQMGSGEVADGAPAPPGHAAPRAAWLLVVPVLLVFLVAPPALGAFSADRVPTAVPKLGEIEVPQLPAGDVVDLRLVDYAYRATWDEGRTLEERTVLLTGFASPAPSGGWYLNRLTLSCCAADARVSRVLVTGAAPPAVDAWVEVTGVWAPSGDVVDDEGNPMPVVGATDVVEVEPPNNPYE